VTINYFLLTYTYDVPSVCALTLLVGRQQGYPACKKTEWWRAGVVICCLERGADLHTAQLMPLPLTLSCFSKIQIGFTFLVPAHSGSPGKGPLNGRVCVTYLRRRRNGPTCPLVSVGVGHATRAGGAAAAAAEDGQGERGDDAVY